MEKSTTESKNAEKPPEALVRAEYKRLQVASVIAEWRCDGARRNYAQMCARKQEIEKKLEDQKKLLPPDLEDGK